MTDMKLLTTSPFARINDRILVSSIPNIPVPRLTIDNKNSFPRDSLYQFTRLQEAFVYVATETVFDYPCVFLTEKSFKGITSMRPFILVAAAGSLAKLRDLGFKTFSAFWDESYDQERDPEQRLIKIVDLIDKISQYDIDHLRKLLVEMQPILQYNFNYYKTLFFKEELAKFERSLDCLK